MKAGETALTMDVFKPAKSNRAAVVFIVSGGWISDHSMLERMAPDAEKTFGGAGFTVSKSFTARSRNTKSPRS